VCAICSQVYNVLCVRAAYIVRSGKADRGKLLPSLNRPSESVVPRRPRSRSRSTDTHTHTRSRVHTHTPNAHTHQTRILVYVGGGARKEVGPAAEQMYNITWRRVRACDRARAAFTAVQCGAPEARCGG